MAAVCLNLQESEYELDRKRKIQENNDMMKQIFGETILEHWPSRKQRSRPKSSSPFTGKQTEEPSSVRRNPKRHVRSLYQTEEESVSEGSDNELTSSNRLLVRWIGPLTKKRKVPPTFGDNNDVDVDCLSFSTKKRKQPSRCMLKPSDFSEEDLLLVADSVSEKHKDSDNGTSCHQCRQKTDDLKTVCRDESCIGIRGQFCGPCLRNRYGESVREALLDPDWSCPPCRGICNCSFCMVKRGRRCTGQLIGVARQNGFPDVRSFLGD